jgi:signal transduction histidine kinase
MTAAEPRADWGGIDLSGPPLTNDRAALLHGRAFWLARLAFALFVVAAVWLNALIMLDSVHEADGLWLAAIGDAQEARSALESGGLRLAGYVGLGVLNAVRILAFLGAATLLVRRSREAIAFVVAIFLVSTLGANPPPNYFEQFATHPIRAELGLTIDLVFAVSFVALFYVFPNGRFVPRWTAIASALWAGSLIWSFFIARSLDTTGTPLDLLQPLLLLGTALGAQVYRYRRVANLVERQQAKWFLGGLGIFLISFIGGNVVLTLVGALDPNASGPNVSLAWAAFETITGVTALFVPIGLVVAVLRFRLFAIDVILNRALVYGCLTACIVAIYVFIVGYLGTLFRTGSNLAISLAATAVVAVLFQPLRLRLQRGANRLLYGDRDEPYAVLVRLGRRLEGTLAPEAVLPTIVETVREALKLPYAAVALWQDGELATVAAAGSPAGDLLRLPLTYQSEPVGALLLGPRAPGDTFDAADRRLLDDLARQAGVAAHAVRLTADLQRSRERLVSAREEERRRVRRDLHDGLGPMLGSLTLKLDVADDLLDRDPLAARALLRDLRGQAQTAIGDIRRLVYALRPPALDDLGLVGALRAEAAQYEHAGLTVVVEAPVALPPLPAAVEVAAYRIALEALTNVVRHASVRSCAIRITVGVERLQLEIVDNGIGLPADRSQGIGLASMRERAEELGGSCTVDTTPSCGTRVSAALPLKAVSAAPPTSGEASWPSTVARERE